MNVQSDEVYHRLELYRDTMAASSFDEAHVAHALEQTWVWRNIFIGETDEELCILAFRCSRRNASSAARCARAFSPSAVKVWPSRETGAAPSAARNVVSHSLICGSPATVPNALPRSTILA